MSSEVTAQMVGENQHIAKVIPIRIKKDARGVSRELPEDPFQNMYAEGGIIEPPYDLFTLAVMPEVSSELGPAIDAMTVNIAKMGHRILPRDGMRKGEEELDPYIRQELSKVKNFFTNAVLEPTQTFTTFRSNLRQDAEATGNAYFEVLPNVITGEPAGLNHLPSWQMRVRKEDQEMTEHIVLRSVQDEQGGWAIQQFPYAKRFRRYVQIRDTDDTKIYFKEWGDPRPINKYTGEIIAEGDGSNYENDDDILATEVVHIKLYCPRSPYGLPRWIGNLFTVFGNRAAEVINYTTFRSNNIPAMMLMATNVQLTDDSIDRIQKFVEERIRDDDNYSTILIIEGEPLTEGMRDPGSMKLDIKELTQVQHTDALFVNYMERNDDKIRRAFRLPPIVMGQSQDYTRSTADSSRKVGEEQVFRPERNEDDAIWNQTIVPALGAANVVFKSNTPDITDNYELTQLLAVAEQSGGLSPQISRIITEDILGRELPPISEEINAEIPFSLTMLQKEAEFQLAEASLSQEEAVDQLKNLRVMMDGNDGISDETRGSIDTLIKLLSMQDKTKRVSSRTKKVVSPPREEYTEPVIEKKNVIKFDNILKNDDSQDEQRIVGGAVLVPGVVDLQGDIYDEQTVEAAAYYWLEHYMDDPKENGLKIMHGDETIFDAARPIQSWVLDRELDFEVDTSAAGDDHPAKDLTTLTYPKGTWILYARIRDDELWQLFKNGELAGWSIGAVATVQQLKRLIKGLG